MNDLRPNVGIGVMVWREGKVLVGRRLKPPGAGQYCWPGGMLEYGETFETCAGRECREEAGIEITNIRFLHLTNMRQYEGYHDINIGFIADWASGEPQVLEPDKMVEWQWCDLNTLPEPIFVTIPFYREALKTGRNFFDL